MTNEQIQQARSEELNSLESRVKAAQAQQRQLKEAHDTVLSLSSRLNDDCDSQRAAWCAWRLDEISETIEQFSREVDLLVKRMSVLAD
jgi:hypothetical protein